MVVGRERGSKEVICVINVTVRCCDEDQLFMWDRLKMVAEQWEDLRICLIGDFNAILEPVEMVGEGGSRLSRESQGLKEFMSSCELLDVKLQGRCFTWYRSNGACKSRIDRALINDYWMESWRDTSLRGLPRSISGHCVIILNTTQRDWGPQPFWFVNVWISHPDFLTVVERSWNEVGV